MGRWIFPSLVETSSKMFPPIQMKPACKKWNIHAHHARTPTHILVVRGLLDLDTLSHLELNPPASCHWQGVSHLPLPTRRDLCISLPSLRAFLFESAGLDLCCLLGLHIMENSRCSIPMMTFPDTWLEKWMRGPTFQTLQVKLHEMKADTSEVELFIRMYIYYSTLYIRFLFL